MDDEKVQVERFQFFSNAMLIKSVKVTHRVSSSFLGTIRFKLLRRLIQALDPPDCAMRGLPA